MSSMENDLFKSNDDTNKWQWVNYYYYFFYY